LHRFHPAIGADGGRHLADALRRRRRDRANGRGLSVRLVDVALPLRFRGFDHLLLLALRGVDGRIALTFRRENHRALLALGAHLLLHRREDVGRRLDVLDLVAQHLDAPRLRCLVELADDRDVDGRALLERAIQIDLADIAAKRRLRELRDGEDVVRDSIRGALRVQDLEIQDAVDTHLHVVARNTDLLRNVDGPLLQRMLVADDVDERHQDVEARVERGVVAPEPLHHERTLLRHDDRGPEHDEQDDDREQHDDDETGIDRHRSLRENVDRQPLQGDDARPLAGAQRRRADVPRAPCRAAQLGAAVSSRRDVAGCYRDLTRQRIHFVRVTHPDAGQQRLAEQAQGDERDDGEEGPFDPRRGDQSSKGEAANHDGGDAEKYDEEPAGRRQFDRGQREAEHLPEPPRHAGRIVARSLRFAKSNPVGRRWRIRVRLAPALRGTRPTTAHCPLPTDQRRIAPMPRYTFRLNGRETSVDSWDPAQPLLYALRGPLGLHGPKFGCGLGQCGACTVIVDRTATRSCTLPVSRAAGRDITTLEGLGTPEQPDAVQAAFIAEQAAQCGYCTNGMVMAAKALLAR